MFGKWHLGYRPEFHPQKRGFDEYFGFLGGAHSYIDAEADPNNPILRGTTPVPKIDYTTMEFAREAISFIERHRSEAWLCYLPFNAVHAPLQAPEKYEKRFASIADTRRRTFCAMLSAMDDAIGDVLAKLSALKLEENTIVFFISDNGGPTPSTTSGNGPLRGTKAQTWEGGIRVPFMVQWNGHLPAGRVEERPVIQLDILPTALAAAGVELNPEWKLDGVNLLPYLRGERTDAPHPALYWRFGAQMAVRMGDWKLVKAPKAGGASAARRDVADTTGAHLYHLARDIGEQTNLAEREPAKVKQLADAWDRWNAQLVPPRWVPGARGAAAQRRRNRARTQP
jgi:arylsulfatase A-like enzyme